LKTGAEKALVGTQTRLPLFHKARLMICEVRIMRALTSSHIFVETGPERYTSNHLSRILSTPPNRAHFIFGATILGPGATSLGQYLETHNLTNPTDHHDAPLQFAHKTSLDVWSYLKEDPMRSKIFNESMRSSAILGAGAVPSFPFAAELKCDSEDQVLIVDVGGGKGQALESIRIAFPELKGRMILQDLPEVIEDAKVSGHLPDSIEAMGVDFFKPQLVKGAKAYFLRRILHDWGDEASKSILKNIISSMSIDSRILINELVLPDEGCDRRMALSDVVMMTFGGMERSETQWKFLLQGVGLEIKAIWRKDGENLSVI